MNDPHQITVRAQTLGGVWETIGVDRYAGIYPTQFQAAADSWGSSTCSFSLKRRPGAPFPDIYAFTPIEVEIAGRVVWSGRVKETPTKEGADGGVTVQGEGWQFHLDDDLFQSVYVHSDMGEWRDCRTYIEEDLNHYTAPGFVNVGDGIIEMGVAAGSYYSAPSEQGIKLDLGPYSFADSIAFNLLGTNINGNSAFTLLVRSSPDPKTTGPVVNYGDAISRGAVTPGLPNGVYSGVFTGVENRYVTIMLIWGVGGAGTLATLNYFLTFEWIRVFCGKDPIGNSLYRTGTDSKLKADMVVSDAIERAAYLFAGDQSGISTGTFTIPSFRFDSMTTPREAIQAVNAYENYQMKVDVNRRLIFGPQTTTPEYEIGEWSGVNFEDTASNSTENVVNRVLVSGEDESGDPLITQRWPPAAIRDPIALNPLSNPTGNVAGGWTAAGGFAFSNVATTITGSTAPNLMQGAASGTFTAGTTVTSAAVTQPMVAGARYRLTVGAFGFQSANGPIQTNWTVLVDGTTVLRGEGYTVPGVNTGTTITSARTSPIIEEWTQQFEGTNYQVRFTVYTASASTSSYVQFDDVKVERVADTLADRAGITKTRVVSIGNPMTLASSQRLGDLYLTANCRTPFRGTFTAVGQGGLRYAVGGGSVHPAHVLPNTGLLVRAAGAIDPDSGAVGRLGRIATVSYDHDSLTSTVALDDDRAGFETLLSRLSVVIGQAK